jgi:hypothetical protein
VLAYDEITANIIAEFEANRVQRQRRRQPWRRDCGTAKRYAAAFSYPRILDGGSWIDFQIGY